jgi:hypothetical protein
MKNRCSSCNYEFPVSTDDLTKLTYEKFLQDGLCDRCRESPERQTHYAEMKKNIEEEKEKNTPKVLDHINCVENPDLIKKKVIVDAMIGGISKAYPIPKALTVFITDPDTHKTEIVYPKIEADNPINIELVEVTNAAKYKRIIDYLKQQYPTDKIRIDEETEFRDLYILRVRPVSFSIKKDLVQNKVVDDKGYEYKSLDIYVVSDKQLTLQPSTLIRIEGLPLPHPKTQRTTVLVYNISFPEDITAFDKEKLDQLKAVFEGKTVCERLNWVLTNNEGYTRIVGRRNVATCGFLIQCTPLYAEFRGEVRNGWGNGAIIGDTTTGKSETIKKLLALAKNGMIVSAESASIVGLTGASVQREKEGWFVDWGFLPLNDRKLLALDGMHKLPKSHIASMAEAERDGKITIAKASKESTSARTRQIKIFNPIDEESRNFSTKSLGEFMYPCQALRTVLDEVSIARLDLAVTSDQRDVTPEQINNPIRPEFDAKIIFYSEIVKFVWSNTAKVEWTEKAELTLLEKATELQKKFYYREIPLASSDMKWKLTRLSISIAGLTLSTTDYKTLQVTEEHVNAIVDFLTQEYTRMGLNILAQEERYERLTAEEVEIIICRIHGQLTRHPIDNLTDVLRFIAIKTHITKDALMAKFNLSETNQTRPLLASLQNEGLLTNKKGFYATAKLNEACMITKNFTVFTTLDAVTTDKKEPPSPLNEKKAKMIVSKYEEQVTLENTNRGFFSDSGKSGKCGKTEDPVKFEVNPEVYKDRYCATECENYSKQACPYFIQKLPEDNLLPLKCYGFKAPNPGEGA